MAYVYQVSVEKETTEYYYFTSLDKCEYFIYLSESEYEIPSVLHSRKSSRKFYNRREISTYELRGLESGITYIKYSICILDVN